MSDTPIEKLFYEAMQVYRKTRLTPESLLELHKHTEEALYELLRGKLEDNLK